jgi:hypothetical protein
MRSNWRSNLFVLSVGAALLIGTAASLTAQDQQAPESAQRVAWDWIKRGQISANVRYRFEAFERDGAPFTAPAYAPTLRLALGYETPAFHGFSVFAQGEAVVVTGPADYSDPTIAAQNRPDRPAILDPRSLQMSQGFVKWSHSLDHKNVELRVGRQEITLNDGRFLSVSLWRQVHGSFDSVSFNADLAHSFSFTYAFINRFNREVGYDATDGQPPMQTHMANLVWSKRDQVRVSLYSLLLDYRSRPQFSLSTQTYGLRANGPYHFTADWSLIYTAEFAKQRNYGTNPNRVDVTTITRIFLASTTATNWIWPWRTNSQGPAIAWKSAGALAGIGRTGSSRMHCVLRFTQASRCRNGPMPASKLREGAARSERAEPKIRRREWVPAIRQ